jgi:hypothetical protein
VNPLLIGTTGSSQAADGFLSMLMPLLGLGAFVVVAWILITAVRRRLKTPSSESSATFSLHDLRAMRSQGLLTDEEYERARDLAAAPTRQSER